VYPPTCRRNNELTPEANLRRGKVFSQRKNTETQLKLQNPMLPAFSLTIVGQYSLFPHNWRVRVRHEQYNEPSTQQFSKEKRTQLGSTHNNGSSQYQITRAIEAQIPFYKTHWFSVLLQKPEPGGDFSSAHVQKPTTRSYNKIKELPKHTHPNQCWVILLFKDFQRNNQWF